MTEETHVDGGESAVVETPDIVEETNDTPSEQPEGKQETPAYQAPTETEWKQFQKDQRATQRRFNKRTAEMYAAQRELDSVRKELAELRTAAGKKAAPNPEQYQNWEEYQAALTTYNVEQLMPKPQEQPVNAAIPPKEEAAWFQSKEIEIVQRVNQLAPHIPDFAETIGEAADLVDQMPWQTRKALYECESPELAAYVLEKQGQLADLMAMPPEAARYVVAQAAQIGIQHIKSLAEKKAKPPTAAPAPMTPHKGTAAGAKSEDRMSGEELLKKYGVY